MKLCDEKFRYRKTTLRNDFTTVFGGMGKRRYIFVDPRHKPKYFKRTKLQMYRRSAQGWRNQTFGRLTKLKLLIRYGHKTPIRRFRVCTGTIG